MPSVALITCARMRPLLAAVTPRSWYLRKLRRPSTMGAVSRVAYASLPVGMAAVFVMMGLRERGAPSLYPTDSPRSSISIHNGRLHALARLHVAVVLR